MPFQDVRTKPWLNTPQQNAGMRTMLLPEELDMLTWLAEYYCTGEGAIVDGGAFLGGSAIALGRGIRNSGRGQAMHSYDMFIGDELGAAQFGGDDFKSGERFRHVFDRETAPYSDLITVHDGNIMEDPWTGGPIELLFIDIAKYWTIQDHLVRDFFTALTPNRSIVIQQDYLWKYLPWIHVLMERLSDHFEILAHTGDNSVVFGLTKEITPAVAEGATWAAMSPQLRGELMRRATSRWSGKHKDYLEHAAASYDVTA